MQRQIKIFILFLFFGVSFQSGFAQNATEYLTPVAGSSWRYQRYDLDTSQHIITSSKTIVTDSLLGSLTIGGTHGYVLKSYPAGTRDSTILNLNADVISFYNGGYPQEGLANIADTLQLGFIPQAFAWYPYLKFGTPPQNNKTDTLFRRDSTIILDGTEFPLTVTVSRTRRPAGVVTVPAGTFTAATPFEITLKIDTWLVTPLGKFAVPLLKLTDTLFVAKNNWIVKEIQGSTYFPLSTIDNDSIPHFRIPGFVRLLEQQTLTSVENEPSTLPRRTLLNQNFPNPFNGMTTISVEIEQTGVGTLAIIDILGRTIATIVHGELTAGHHRFLWNSDHSPSGLYFYELRTASGFHDVKKMILQK